MTMGIALVFVLGLLLAGGAYVLARRIRARMAWSMKIYEDVKKEKAVMATLPPDEAYSGAEAIITNQASAEEWGPLIPSPIEGQLTTLDPRLAGMLRRFRRIRLPEYEGEATEISAEFFSAAPPTPIPAGHVMIGGNVVGDDRTRDEWALTTKPGDSRVYEIITGRVRAEYRTIAHFILLTVDAE